MKHSTFVWDNYLDKHKAFGHDNDNKPTINSPSNGGYWSGKTFNAYSSLHSEAKEYAQFLVALLKQKGLKNETFTEMLKEHTHFEDDNSLKLQVGQTGWGLGMAQKPIDFGMMHMHTGNNRDFQSYMMILPEKTDFKSVDNRQLKGIQCKLNNRPRKILSEFNKLTQQIKIFRFAI